MTVRPEELEGLINAGVCEVLRTEASKVPVDQAIVEIGSYKGKSTCCLATGSRGAPVYAVDPWFTRGNPSGRFGFAEESTFGAFLDQIEQAGCTEIVTPIRAFSTDAAKRWQRERVGLLYVDGDHGVRSVMEDFRAWRPHLENDAVVVFDDVGSSTSPGVRKAIDRLLATGEIPNLAQAADGRLGVVRFP